MGRISMPYIAKALIRFNTAQKHPQDSPHDHGTVYGKSGTPDEDPSKPLTDTGKRTEGQWHSFTMDAPGSHNVLRL
jgi:hypothetical protein